MDDASPNVEPIFSRLTQRGGVAAALLRLALLMLSPAPVFAQQTGTSAPIPRTARERPAAPPPPGTPITGQQQAPLIGTLAPAAARASRGNADRPSTAVGLGIPASALGPAQRHLLGVGAYVPLAVIDAPAYGRGTSTRVIRPLSPPQVTAPAFYPTTAPPTWNVVKEAHPVQAWRLVDVEDTICDASGACAPVSTRLKARWMPALGGYAFRDRIGRIWRVE